MKSWLPLIIRTGTRTRGAKLNASTSGGFSSVLRPPPTRTRARKRGSTAPAMGPNCALRKEERGRDPLAVVGRGVAYAFLPPMLGIGLRRLGAGLERGGVVAVQASIRREDRIPDRRFLRVVAEHALDRPEGFFGR